MKNSRPARIHAILARESELGIVIRRGPSKEVASFLWDTDTDSFELGQWFKGRIYERRSDISPDGEHFLYFGLNGLWDVANMGAWSAVSKTPYLKALDLYPTKTTVVGGGRFLDKKNYEIAGDSCPPPLRKDSGLVARQMPSGGDVTPEYDLYVSRLKRDGWLEVSGKEGDDENLEATLVLEKSLEHNWRLKMTVSRSPINSGQPHILEKYGLYQTTSNKEITLSNCDWADKNNDMLVWSHHGRMFRAPIYPNGVFKRNMIFDFNRFKYRSITAPY